LQLLKSPITSTQLEDPKIQWRVNPAIAGGGLFHDLAPHQLDLMLHFFGSIQTASGIATNQAKLYAADDLVSGNILFNSGVVFHGIWCFTVNAEEEKEVCEIVGSNGKISFSVFGDYTIYLNRNGNTKVLNFDKLEHVQQPMIEQVVKYFMGQGQNPCPAEDGVEVMRLIDVFTN
jgi:predicted dehydrogenase